MTVAPVEENLLFRSRRIAGAIGRSPMATARALRSAIVMSTVEAGWPHARPTAQPHGLPAPLVLSLTSFPPRFATLPATLKCLLSQTLKPDAVILWLATEDAPLLPSSVLALQSFGLSIRTTKDLRSYKKIIPTLRLMPSVFIATADDDLYYPSTWLEEMVRAYRDGAREIPCHRAHRIALGPDGAPARYLDWTIDADIRDASPLMFPTTGHGVLFPPDSLHPDTVDEQRFMALCPAADDIWLYWMARRAGYVFRRAVPPRTLITWPRTQRVALRLVNQTGGGNDTQIQAMMMHYGFPSP